MIISINVQMNVFDSGDRYYTATVKENMNLFRKLYYFFTNRSNNYKKYNVQYEKVYPMGFQAVQDRFFIGYGEPAKFEDEEIASEYAITAFVESCPHLANVATFEISSSINKI